MNASEYSRDRSPRQNGGETPRRRLRSLYFTLASLWGFVVGVAALGAGSHLAGRGVVLEPWVIGATIPGAAFAGLGGIVAAGAYREAKERRRR